MANSQNSLSQNSLSQTNPNWWHFLPYALFGILAFSVTSASSLHILLKTYLMILEIPAGLVLIYLGIPKLVRHNRNHPK